MIQGLIDNLGKIMMKSGEIGNGRCDTHNGFLIAMVGLGTATVLALHCWGSVNGYGNSLASTGSGSCVTGSDSGSSASYNSSVPMGATPSLGGGNSVGVLRAIAREGLLAFNRSWPENSRRLLELGGLGVLSSGTVQVNDPELDPANWRVVAEVFPFEGSPERNPGSFVYAFQSEVYYSLTPGSSVYLGGATYRNDGTALETGKQVFRIHLRTDEAWN